MVRVKHLSKNWTLDIFFGVNCSISCLRKHAVNDFFNTNEMKVVLQS